MRENGFVISKNDQKTLLVRSRAFSGLSQGDISGAALSSHDAQKIELGEALQLELEKGAKRKRYSSIARAGD